MTMTAAAATRDRDFRPPAQLAVLGRRALLTGGAAAAVSAGALLLDRERFLGSYLLGWLFWLSVALGALALTMLQHLTSGRWGLLGRRVLEAAARTLGVLLLLGLPLLIDLDAIYSWARPEALAADPLLQHKRHYLNAGAFWARAGLYFVAWGVPAWLLSRESWRQDEGDDPFGAGRRMRRWSGPFLGLYCLAASFASFDWLMSLDPHWYSTIYGVYWVGTHALAGLAFLVVVAYWLSRREPMSALLDAGTFHDYGNLLLAFVALWAYFSFSQMLIIWSGNLPEHVTWYLHRRHGGWQLLSVALVVLHFFVPFALLLSRSFKRDSRAIAGLALGLLALRWVDLFWQAGPSLRATATPHPWDLVALLAVGGLWLAAFLRELARAPLVPLGDPQLAEVLGDD